MNLTSSNRNLANSFIYRSFHRLTLKKTSTTLHIRFSSHVEKSYTMVITQR